MPGTRNYANTSGLQVEKLIVVEIRKFQSPKDPETVAKTMMPLVPEKGFEVRMKNCTPVLGWFLI